MPHPPSPAAGLEPEARRILKLARKERAAAVAAIGTLPTQDLVRLVCEVPPGRRSELLDLMPAPEKVIPRIPEAELCFTVKAIGLESAGWILEHATPEQLVACLDLDAWNGTEPDRGSLEAWLDALAETGPKTLMGALRALDPELVVIHLRARIGVVLKPNDDESWQPPESAQTVEGQFYFWALHEKDDLAGVIVMLRTLFQDDYWTYFRMMQGVIWELDGENQEWALRWRAGRLEDLGFPSWDDAMSIYRTMAPRECARIPEGVDPLDVSEWQLPVWMPTLPVGPETPHLVFRAIAELDEDERRASFFAFVAVANKVAVADRLALSDAESTPHAIEKAARFASLGLEFVASENRLAAGEVLRRVPMERLFRTGANLDPEAARP